jgi:hypothetical protein
MYIVLLFSILINYLIFNSPMIGLNWAISACSQPGSKILLTCLGHELDIWSIF